MKKLFAMGISVVLAASMLVGCGGGSDTKNESKSKAKGVKVIEIDLTDEEYAFGVDKDQPELLKSINDYIKEIKDNGTFEEICNKYFGDGEPEPVPSAKLDSSKDQLVVATNAAFEPFEYTKGESYLGIDMEIAAGLAKKLGKELVIQNMKFDAVCLSVGQHKSDIALAGLTIKEDRKKYVDFSDAYYSAAQRLIVRADNTEFDKCSKAEDVEAILKKKDKSVNIGVQNGTTGQFYCEGDKDWGFEGFQVTTKGYENGSLAVQDLINKNLDYVVIDSAPAACISESINKMQ